MVCAVALFAVDAHADVCLKGKFANTVWAWDCESCTAGYYCPYTLGKNNLTRCPTGYDDNPNKGQDAQSDCQILTTAGKYIATANGSLADCAAGTYCPGGSLINYGSTGEISSCPSGYTSNPTAGQDAQSDCQILTTAGKYIATANGSLADCAAGTYCPGGILVNYGSTGGAVTCPANAYCPSRASSYTLCSTLGGGLYNSSATGSDAANDCVANVPTDNRLDSSDATSYTSCAPGFALDSHNLYYDSTSPECSIVYYDCAPGQYLPENSTSCEPCPTGQYCVGITDVNYSDVAQGASSCPVGYDHNPDAGQDELSDCQTITTAGKYLADTNGEQVDCIENNYCPGDILINYMSIGGTIACVAPSSFSPPSSDDINDCGRILHMGEHSVYLRSDKQTSPSLHVRYGDNIYYGNMNTEPKGNLFIKFNDTIYSVYDDTM